MAKPNYSYEKRQRELEKKKKKEEKAARKAAGHTVQNPEQDVGHEAPHVPGDASVQATWPPGAD